MKFKKVGILEFKNFGTRDLRIAGLENLSVRRAGSQIREFSNPQIHQFQILKSLNSKILKFQ